MGRKPSKVSEGSKFVPPEVDSLTSSVAFFDEATNTIYVSFDKEFELEDDSCNYFSMYKRKCFSKAPILEQIVVVLNEIFSRSDLATELYASLRVLIAQDSNLDVDTFKSYVAKMMPEIMPLAQEYVAAHYVPNPVNSIPEENRRGRKSNPELQFTNEHSIMLLRISFCIRSILPLILEYCAVHPEQNFDSVYLAVIEPCFEADPDSERIDILNKIFKIIDSRVKATKYSDKVIWKFLRSYSINTSTLEDEFFRKILIEIIPKLEYRDCLSFLHVTVKSLIQYQFRFKFPMSFHPINLVESKNDGNELSNLERLEFNLVRIDESDGVLTEAKLYDLLLTVINNKTHPVSAEEFRYYRDRVQINTIQTQLLFLFLAKHIGRVNALYNLRYSQYVFLLIYFKKWLESKGYKFLSRWITMTFDEGEKRMVDTAEFTASLTKNKRYNFLNREKYKHMIGSFTRNNVISKIIVGIYSNLGEVILSYDEDVAYSAFADQYEGGRENPEVFAAFLQEYNISNLSEYNIMTVSDEVLRFIESI